MSDEPIRILLVDDHPIVRDGLAAVLSTQRDFAVVGEAATGDDAVSVAARERPDVALVDLEIPPTDGVDIIRRLAALPTPVKAIVFTAYDSDDRILGAIEAGARGYLLKGAPRQEIFNGVRAVAAGGSMLHAVVASRLMRRAVERERDPLVEPLTAREGEALKLLARGLSNKEIASELDIAERTVKFHISAILGKLGATNRTEALSIAVRLGLVEPTAGE